MNRISDDMLDTLVKIADMEEIEPARVGKATLAMMCQEIKDSRALLKHLNRQLAKLSPCHGMSRSTDVALNNIIYSVNSGRPYDSKKG